MNLKEAVDSAKSGNSDAFTYLYEQAYKKCYYTAKKIVKTDDLAQDITQDAFVKVFNKIDTLDDHEKFISWACQITANTALNELKKNNPILFSETETEEGGDISDTFYDDRVSSNPELSLDKQETSRLVQEMMNDLSDEQRICITMFYADELSVKEIAQALNVSENTVKSRLNYGRKNIKEKVLELEKKGTKLYGLLPFTFFLYLFKTDASAMEIVAPKVSFAAVANATQHVRITQVTSDVASSTTDASSMAAQAASNIASDASAATNAANAGASAAKISAGAVKAALGTTAGKITAGLVAAAVVTGAGVSAYNSIENDKSSAWLTRIESYLYIDFYNTDEPSLFETALSKSFDAPDSEYRPDWSVHYYGEKDNVVGAQSVYSGTDTKDVYAKVYNNVICLTTYGHCLGEEDTEDRYFLWTVSENNTLEYLDTDLPENGYIAAYIFKTVDDSDYDFSEWVDLSDYTSKTKEEAYASYEKNNDKIMAKIWATAETVPIPEAEETEVEETVSDEQTQVAEKTEEDAKVEAEEEVDAQKPTSDISFPAVFTGGTYESESGNNLYISLYTGAGPDEIAVGTAKSNLFTESELYLIDYGENIYALSSSWEQFVDAGYLIIVYSDGSVKLFKGQEEQYSVFFDYLDTFEITMVYIP